jgi:hypothetical protein
MMNLMTIPHPWTLAIDRTNWKVGKIDHNILMLAVVLEDTHLREMERLSKLVALLTLAMVWAIRVGEWLTFQIPIPVKNHGRKAKSIFRVGCDYLTQYSRWHDQFQYRQTAAIASYSFFVLYLGVLVTSYNRVYKTQNFQT